MKKICLSGRLAKKFSPQYSLDVRDPAEAIQALCYMVPGFEKSLREGSYTVTRVYPDREEYIGTEEVEKDALHVSFGTSTGLRIVPVVAGARRGSGKVVLGALLVASAFFTGGATLGLGATAGTVFGTSITYGNIATLGATLLLQGASSLLAPTPKGPVDPNESYVFSGLGNTSTQGVAVPLVFGECFTGSVVISTGLVAEDKDDG